MWCYNMGGHPQVIGHFYFPLIQVSWCIMFLCKYLSFIYSNFCVFRNIILFSLYKIYSSEKKLCFHSWNYVCYINQLVPKFEHLRNIISVEPLDLLKAQFSIDFSQSKEIVLTTFTFLYVQFLDTSCTLLGLISSMNISTADGIDFPRSRQAFSVTAITSIFGASFGLSPLVIFIESIAGSWCANRIHGCSRSFHLHCPSGCV